MKSYLNLFLTMLKIGAFTFGGGYAMIALLEHEFITKKEWLKKDEFLDMVSIAESTPGPIAINAATYIGYKLLGVSGSLVATLGVCIPSLVIIYVISLFLDTFLSLTPVAYAFRGIQVCVIYLIFTAGLNLFKEIKKNLWNLSLLSIVILAMLLTTLLSIQFSSVYYILICGGLGVFLYLLRKMMHRKEES